MNKAVLYIGSLAEWCNSFRRYKAVKAVCPNTEAINTDRYLLPKLISGFQHHLNIGPGVFLLNRQVRALVSKKKYDIILVDNKPFLSRRTLRFVKERQPSIKIANVLTDDPFGQFGKSWRRMKQTIPLYDIFFVQRKINIKEFKAAGARNVSLCYRSFDPAYNRPLPLEEQELSQYHASVGFVGTYENVRASYIASLIQNNIPVSVTGNDWPNREFWDIIKPHYKGPSVYGEEYIKTINGMDIALHFLRHANRDEQDSRTFEIPACKVFMLAENSDVHQQLFKENEEAVFFSSKEELLEKVRYYLSAKEERQKIALKGYQRCITAGYDHETRMRRMLETINDLS